jgi:hypothetical protein
MTRKSTPKFEVYHVTTGQIVLDGVSKTEATLFARSMNEGSKAKRIAVRPMAKAA